MKKILFSAIIWLVALSCLGQEPAGINRLSLSLGMGYCARQDLIFSPLVHKDFSLLNVGITYAREAKWYQKASLRFGSFNPSTIKPYDFTIHGETITAYPHSFTLIDLDYLFGKKIKESQKSTLTVGGLLGVDIQAVNYAYGRVGSFGYYSMIGIGVFARHQFEVNEKSKLTTTLQLPIVAWMARSPYLVNDDTFIENTSSHSGFKTFMAFQGDGQCMTWNKLQTVDVAVKYSYSLSKKWSLAAGYLFELIHTNEPRNLLSFRNSLNLSANFNF